VELPLNGNARVCLVGVVVVISLTAFVATALPRAAHGDAAATGTFALRFEVPVRDTDTECPAGNPVNVECQARTGTAVVRGLGAVAESYAFLVENAPAGCTAPALGDVVRLLPSTVRLVVAGKGEIDISTGGTGCVGRSTTEQASESFTITGGSGVYADAAGGGTVTTISYGPPSLTGNDTWAGTLVVPGLDFDLTPPALTGAHSKTVHIPRRLKRIRVAYTVTAVDAVDGTRPVSCRPKSHGWFGVGRTRVRCTAADTSGNVGAATFLVTVTRRQ
jgi:hypothetical protein